MNFKASYLKLLESGDLIERIEESKKYFDNYKLCPHRCLVNRKEEVGVCGAGNQPIE